MTNIAKNIRILTANKNLTYRELAKRAGVSEINISFIANGRTKNPRIETVANLARALETDVTTLLSPDLLRI